MVNTLNPPASVILSWPKPNYINPTDQGPALFICCILFSIVGVFIVAARVYSRLFLTRAPGSDDVLIVFGCLFTVALSVLVAVANQKYHNGRHIWDIPINLYAGHRLNLWICEFVYLAAASCIKISILLFYRRLSVSFPKRFLYATWAGIVYNVLMSLGFVIALLLLCSPIKAVWKSYDFMWLATHKFHCGTEQVSLPLSGAMSVLGDLYATVLPMFMISTTVRSPQQKVGLYVLFGLGFFSVVAGIVRTYLMYRLINVDYDFLPSLYFMWICTIVELYFGIFAASAPALKPFFKKFVVMPISKVKSSTARSTAAKSPGQWSSNAPWSRASTHDSRGMDIEKVGIAHGFPEQIHPATHTTWVELRSNADRHNSYEASKRPYSQLISFPEERSPSLDKIAIAR